MEYALGVLIVWGALFLPLGLVTGWIALGASARRQAAPMALVTGLALGIVILALLDRLSVGLDGRIAAAIMIALAAAAWISMWRLRRKVLDFTRPILALCGVMFILVLTMQAPVFDPPSGPASYGQGDGAALEVAAIRAIATGEATTDLQRRAAERVDAHPAGFEQLAGFTVGLGNDDRGWTAFELTALMAGLLLVLTAPALLVFARWRGVGRFGQFLILACGVLTPQAMLALGFGVHASVATIPFATSALVALLLARRDRGWLAIAAINSMALLCIAGPVALLPIAISAIVWWLLHQRVREHLAAVDIPVAGDRPLILGGAVFLAAVGAVAEPVFRHPGLPWPSGGRSVTDALVSWPFTWIGTDLTAEVPRGWELAMWAVGPVLASIAVVYAVGRKEAREVSVLAGIFAAVAIGAAVAAVNEPAGVNLIHYAWLTAAPLLAVIGIRAGGLARSTAKEQSARRWRGFAPMLAAAIFVVFSMAASTTTASRFVHAPSLSGLAISSTDTLVLSSDPWLGIGVDGNSEGVPPGARDLDEIAIREPRGGRVLPRPYERLLVDNDPFSSEPPSGYTWSGFDGRRPLLEYRLDPPAAKLPSNLVIRHDPVERLVRDTGPGGLVIPPFARDCGSSLSLKAVSARCTPQNLATESTCPPRILRAAETQLPRVTAANATGQKQQGGRAYASACIEVPLAGRGNYLKLHIRDVGAIFMPGDAIPRGDVDQSDAKSDGPITLMRRTASAQYGDGNVFGSFDVSVEGSFGAGVGVRGGAEGQTGGSAATTIEAGFTGWSPLLADLTLANGVTLENMTSAHVELGRVVARRTDDLNRSCDLQVAASDGSVTSVGGAQPLIVARVRAIPGRKDAVQLIVLSFIQEDQKARALLLDWVEQFEEAPLTTSCTPTEIVPAAPVTTQPVTSAGSQGQRIEQPAGVEPLPGADGAGGL